MKNIFHDKNKSDEWKATAPSDSVEISGTDLKDK